MSDSGLYSYSKGFCLVLSGPSGAGKTTIGRLLTNQDSSVVQSISVTTRKMRPDEKDGEDYHFTNPDDFKLKISQGKFLEWVEVYDGIFYGTLHESINKIMSAGKIALMVIDVRGGKVVKKLLPDATLVFLIPPSVDVLAERLKKRGFDTEEEINNRLNQAQAELRCLPDYDYAVENNNDKQQITVDAIFGILGAERCRISRWEH